MTRGYRRGRVADVGSGAAALWLAFFDSISDQDRPGPETAGEIRTVFERSAYLELAFAEGAEYPGQGPPLVLLSGEGIEGPLVTQVSFRNRPFRGGDLDTGMRCRVYPSLESADDTYILALGKQLEVTIAPETLSTDQPAQLGHIAQVCRNGPVWTRSIETLQYLDQTDHEDGLDVIPLVLAATRGESLPAPWDELVQTWRAVVSGSETGEFDGSWLGLLGRGPGATPSGDDIVAGMLLALLRGTDGKVHQRIREASELVVAEASDRTTAVSTALLAQAAQGRSAPNIDRALSWLFTGIPDECTVESVVDELASIGHSSGIDTLVGMLIAMILIGPAADESEPPQGCSR